MPYTSPISRTPVSSAANSPCSSRRSSYTNDPSGTTKAELPRSTSYLARHRRSGSVKISCNSNMEIVEAAEKGDEGSEHRGSLRQSPSPVTSDNQIPAGVIVSPPESTQNSSDDESWGSRNFDSRGYTSEKFPDLQSVIKIVGPKCEDAHAKNDEKMNKSLAAFVSETPAETTEDDNSRNTNSSTSEVRHRMHYRSSYDGRIIRNHFNLTIPDEDVPRMSSDMQVFDDEQEFDDEPEYLPTSMVRKKSGELVRPALRPPLARRRPSSMPGTPTYSKAVHFDSQLEHIRHFLQVDRPLAVSAGSSPVPAYDSDNEFPFGEAMTREPPYKWEIVLSNFPTETPLRLAQPVRVERVFLSYDNETLVGSVMVANLAFKKTVVVRFTLDYWRTTSEVVAEFNQDVRQPVREGYDRFNFNIKLTDQANLEAKTMFFCVKYCVNDLEYWDNNNSTNFQVDFRKKMKARRGLKKWSAATRLGNNSLPRSNHRALPSRPKFMPVAFDDYTDDFNGKNQYSNFKQAVDSYSGEFNSLRLKGSRSNGVSTSNSQLQKIGQPNGNAFGNRYDFGASLTAAINASNLPTLDSSPMANKPSAVSNGPDEAISPLSEEPPDLSGKVPSSDKSISTLSEPTHPIEIKKLGLSSQSYNELLDKYCFFGSGKSSPQLKDGTINSCMATSKDHRRYQYELKQSHVSSDSIEINEYYRSNETESKKQSPSSTASTRFGTSMYPSYKNLHDGYHFLEAHSATAIRG